MCSTKFSLPGECPVRPRCGDKLQRRVIALGYGLHAFWFQHILCQVSMEIQDEEWIESWRLVRFYIEKWHWQKKMRIKTFGISKKQIKGKFFIVKQTEHEVKCKEYDEGMWRKKLTLSVKRKEKLRRLWTSGKKRHDIRWTKGQQEQSLLAAYLP